LVEPYGYTLVLEDALTGIHGAKGRTDLACYFWLAPAGSNGTLTVIPGSGSRDHRQKQTVERLRSMADARDGKVPTRHLAIIEFKVKDVPARDLLQQLTRYVEVHK